MTSLASNQGFNTSLYTSNEEYEDFDAVVRVRDLQQEVPLLSMLDKMKKPAIRSSSHTWWEEVNTIIAVTVNGQVTSGVTTIVVDGTDPDQSNPSINYGSALALRRGDILQVTFPGATFDPKAAEQVRVESVTSATTFTVSRGWAGTTPATIPDNAVLVPIGNPLEEGYTAEGPRTRAGRERTNSITTINDVWEVTELATKLTSRRIKNILLKEQNDSEFRFMQKMEGAMLFGKKASSMPYFNGKKVFTSDGLIQQIADTSIEVFPSAPSIADLKAALEPIYRFTAPGTRKDSRIAFCGYTALDYLQTLFVDNTAAQGLFLKQEGGVARKWGLNVRTIEFTFGTLNLVEHPMLKQIPAYDASILIIDNSQLESPQVMPVRHTKNIQGNNQKVISGEYSWTGMFNLKTTTTSGLLMNVSA